MTALHSSPAPLLSTEIINRAKLHFKAGEFPEAAACCRDALKAGQSVVDSLMLLGSIGTLMNEAQTALPLLQLAASLAPKDISILNALGLAYQAVHNHEQACHCFEQVLTLSPGRPETIRNLAHTHVKRKDWRKAKALFGQLRAINNLAQKDWLPYALSLHYLQESRHAALLLREFLSANPKNAEAWQTLGMCLYDAQGASAAIAAYKTAIQHDDKQIGSYLNLSAIFNKHGNPEAAAKISRDLLRIDPTCIAIHVNYGLALGSFGKSQESVESFKKVLDSEPTSHFARSNYIFYSQYLDNTSPQALYQRHYEWNVRHAEPLRNAWPKHHNVPNPARRLRIGYVSPDLKGHSCAWFMLDLLAHHDHSAVEVFVYANVDREDGITAQLKQHVDVWHDVRNLSETARARKIYEDGVDILIDLAGHTGHNSLITFACKPAPVQATWLGYPGTTGLAAIDYRISDPWLTPDGTPEIFSEQVYNLPRVSHCFHPPEAPAPSPLPALNKGHITFGSFNTFAKVSDTAARLWTAALDRVPTARLLLKSRYIASTEARETILDRFRRAGADLSRIEFAGGNERQQDHLQQYGLVDIALDSFPYGGMTTTCEALWMGVPVITMAGDRTSARYGTSVLNAVGLGDLVATTPEEFGAIAARLASNTEWLADLRAGLRERMANSPLCDGAGFARAMEAAYRDMWVRWCRSQGRG